MLTYNSQVVVARDLLTKGCTKIYVMAELVTTANGTVPSIKRGDEWVPCGWTDDLKLFAYIREAGKAELRDYNNDTCMYNEYLYLQPARIVFCSPNENRNHDELLLFLLQSLRPYKITGINTTKQLIVATEQVGGTIEFGPNDFYAAIDFIITGHMELFNCPVTIDCGEMPNEICTPPEVDTIGPVH